jgi:predicted nucleic acid-binding protein
VLLDTNIWLELLLGQEKAARVSRLLSETPVERLHVTDFSLHSVGVILTRAGRLATLSRFLNDLLSPPGVSVVRLSPEELRLLPAISDRFELDFDDAYQYAAARCRGLALYSYDRHFDRTDLPRREP